MTLSWLHMSVKASQFTNKPTVFANKLSILRATKLSKLCITGPFVPKFPAQMTSNTEDISIAWQSNEKILFVTEKLYR